MLASGMRSSAATARHPACRLGLPAGCSIRRPLPSRQRGPETVAAQLVTEDGTGMDSYASYTEEAVCSILNVRINNHVNPRYTKLTIEVQQYPGLFRTVAWTLNGMGVRAQNASMKVDEEGYASQVYWLCDLQGKKLSDTYASNVQDSLQDFIETCMPSRGKEQEEWWTGDVYVSNKSHDKYTEVLIKGEPAKPGFLLEIATVMAACGAEVHEATIQGDSDFEQACPNCEDHDFKEKGRLFRFLISEGSGGKLSPGRVAAILYTLDLVAGKGYQPTRLSDVQMAATMN